MHLEHMPWALSKRRRYDKVIKWSFIKVSLRENIIGNLG
jgi:hypothetical protein